MTTLVHPVLTVLLLVSSSFSSYLCSSFFLFPPVLLFFVLPTLHSLTPPFSLSGADFAEASTWPPVTPERVGEEHPHPKPPGVPHEAAQEASKMSLDGLRVPHEDHKTAQ
eukprot:2033897-Pyramimonas_sp.AAC.1